MLDLLDFIFGEPESLKGELMKILYLSVGFAWVLLFFWLLN